MKSLRLWAVLPPLLLLMVVIPHAAAQEHAGVVVVLEIKETISSATYTAFKDALAEAESVGADALIILLNTPGGSVDATLNIIEEIDNAPVPIVVYVHPIGARAWSAGTYILMASHVAAMAPSSVIGSCQPTAYSPLTGSAPVNESKIINAMLTVMEAHAKARGRNVTAARDFVLKNLNLDAEEALKFHVIDVIADSLPDLLQKLDGMKVKTATGEVVISTRNVKIVEFSPDVGTQVLRFLSDPLLASILFLVGLYALIFGLASPGHGSEIVGAILLILGLVGLGFDINLGVIILIALGLVLLIAELLTPGFGVMGISGIICLVLGSLFLGSLNPAKWSFSGEWYSQFIATILVVTAAVASFFAFAFFKVIQARRRKPFLGGFEDELAEALDDIPSGKTGFVRFKGEYWKAKAVEDVKSGEKVVILKKDGPILIVKPHKEETR